MEKRGWFFERQAARWMKYLKRGRRLTNSLIPGQIISRNRSLADKVLVYYYNPFKIWGQCLDVGYPVVVHRRKTST